MQVRGAPGTAIFRFYFLAALRVGKNSMEFEVRPIWAQPALIIHFTYFPLLPLTPDPESEPSLP